jgi:uncharacterized protein YceK
MKRAPILLLLLLPGCSTVVNLFRYPPAPGKVDSFSVTYGGTQRDVAMRRNPYDCTGMSVVYATFDFPFSVVLDTAILPLALLTDLFCLPPGDPTDPPFMEYEEGRRRRP